MIGVAVRTKLSKRTQALPATRRGTGTRNGARSSTSGDWRPGSSALAPRPAPTVSAVTIANAPAAAHGPASGVSAARTTAERAEHGTSVARNAARTRSRRVASTLVA